MRAVIVMFDTLVREALEPYGSADVHTPNFTRLAERSVRFDRCYAGSMPCMPARREMHTGRHNFLHRSWGPLEPFDDSVPEMLDRAGVHTHLATDHYHYWEDGGATYHNRFTTYELFRGQESDSWKGQVGAVVPEWTRNPSNKRQKWNWINRKYQQEEKDHSQTRTVDAGVEFLRTNAGVKEPWFLQVETFDPHEPFFTYDHYRERYETEYEGPHHDWPPYRRVIENDAESEHLRNGYRALLSQCDHSLGRILDEFDRLELWDDTLLLVCTDHGYLFGERGWWGKNHAPWFEETIHTPLFLHDPRHSHRDGTASEELVQTIDIAPTLLDVFGLDPTPDMHGVSLSRILGDASSHEHGVHPDALFGSAFNHVNITDGRYVYMRASADESNGPRNEYTLMPTHMVGRFTPEELKDATLHTGFGFTKGAPVLKIPVQGGGPGRPGNSFTFGTRIYDLATDPDQLNLLVDDELELRLAQLLVDRLREQEAPPEQYIRLGLPEDGEVGEVHLLARAQRKQVEAINQPFPRRDDFGDAAPVVSLTLGEVLADSALAEVLTAVIGPVDSFGASIHGPESLLSLLAALPFVSGDQAHAINERLSDVLHDKVTT